MKEQYRHTLLVSILFFLQAIFAICSRNSACMHVITMHDATWSEWLNSAQIYPLNHCQRVQILGLQLVHECTNILHILRTEKNDGKKGDITHSYSFFAFMFI